MTAKRRFCAPKNHDTALYGRDSSGRCLACKRETGRAVRYLRIAEDRGIREAERTRRREEERERQEAELRERQAERARRRELEYQRAIKAGGDVAAEARWQRLSEETLVKTGSTYSLCQWQDERAPGEWAPRQCTRRTQGVFCGVHDRQLEREQAKEAKR